MYRWPELSTPLVLLAALTTGAAWAHGDEDPPDPLDPDVEYDHVRTHLHGMVQFGDLATEVGKTNDVWGYVSPGGIEYAIVGFDPIIAFADVSDPHEPRVVAEIPHVESTWADMAVYGEYAYASNEGGGGIQVFDLTDIDSDVVTELTPVTDYGLDTAHNVATDADSGFLYALGPNIAGGGVIAMDLADPAAPVVVGGWSRTYVHDAEFVTYDEGDLAGHQIGYLYAGRKGLILLDVTDKSDLRVLSRATYPELRYAHQGWLDKERQLVYLNDEGDEKAGYVSSTTTYVFDVSDPFLPELVSTFSSGMPSIDHNLMFLDGIVYEANYTSGLRVFDARLDPYEPPEIGFFDTHPETNAAKFSGAWGVFVLPSGTVLLSDINRGLFVIGAEEAIDDPPDPFALVGPTDGDVITPDDDFEWERAWGASSYTVTVGADEDLTVELGSVETTELSLPAVEFALDPCTTVWWTVTASNLNGDTGAGETRSAETDCS